MKTCDTVVMGHGVASGQDFWNRTRTCDTHDHNTMVWPIPMSHPTLAPNIFSHLQAFFSTFMHLHSCKLTQGKIFIKVSRITETSIECYGQNKIISNSECGCAIASWSMLQWHCTFMVNEQIIDIIFVVSTSQLLTALLTPKSMPRKAKSSEKKAQICCESSTSRTESGQKRLCCNIYSHGFKNE